MLDDSRLEALEFATPTIPPSIERTQDMWTHTNNTRDERRARWTIGGISILVGMVFLGGPGRTMLSYLDNDSSNLLMYWGPILFLVPFAVIGFVAITVGLVLANMRVEYHFDALGIRRRICLFVFTVTELRVLSSQMLALRVFPTTYSANGLALGLVTQAGVLLLPIYVTDEQHKSNPRLLRRYARWLVDTIHRQSLPFDATPFYGSPQKIPDLNLWPVFLRQLSRLGITAIVLGMLGFAFIFIGATQNNKDLSVGSGLAAASSASTEATASNAQSAQSMRDAIPKDVVQRALSRNEDSANNTKLQPPTQRPADCAYVDIAFCGTLAWAVIEKRHDVVKSLFSESSAPLMLATAPDRLGWSAWAYALSKGNAAMVQLFIEQGVPIKGANLFPFNDSTQQIPPLLFAIQYDNAAAIGVLVASGADAYGIGPWGYPVANFAAYYGKVEALRALAAAGVDLQRVIPKGRTHDGETMLMHAAQGGKMAAIEYLLSMGSKIGHADSRGNTAVDHAMRYGHTALAVQLRMKQLTE